MTAMKRRGPRDSALAATVTAPNDDGRPSKRRKSDGKSAPQTTSANGAASAKPSGLARLVDPEVLFPRGGASVLSPLEHKRIQVRAKKDVLFETEGTSSLRRTVKATSDGRLPASRETSHAKGLFDSGRTANVKVESLNFKRLVNGSLVLGQVCDINPLDVSVALPNNLTGQIPITAVSQTVSRKVQEELDEDGSDHGGDNNVDLASLFSVGQFLRVAVTSTIEQGSPAVKGKRRRHIELSSMPEHANLGLAARDLVKNCTVMAAVASVEDHGLVMDLGIPGADVRGFLPRQELEHENSTGRVQTGAVLLCLVTGTSTNGKIAQLTTLSHKLGAVKDWPSAATTMSTLLPGTAVDVLVSGTSPRGIIGKVLGHVDVTSDVTHCTPGLDDSGPQERFEVGSRLMARVVCTFPTSQQPKLGISILPHVLSLKQYKVDAEGVQRPPLEVLPTSSLVERCVVRKTEPDIGLWVDLGIEGVRGFVHISRVRDGKVDALHESSGPFKIGSVHRGRVLGYNAPDNCFLLSFEQRILEQPFLHIQDVPVGGVVDGIVQKLIINEHGIAGLILTLADGISGLVPEMHMADRRLQHPEKKFKEGLKVKARVLSTDPSRHQLRLTLKETLVNSEMAPVKSFDEVSIGLHILGTIVNVLQNGAVVQFYGSLRGFLPIAEMSEAYIHDPKEHYRTGQVVGVHILELDAATNRLIVSCKDPAAFGLEKQMALRKLAPGEVAAARVIQKTEDHVILELLDGALKAALPAGHLSDAPGNKIQAALKKIHVGQVLSEIVVLDKNEGRRTLTLSRKPSLVGAAREGKLIMRLEEAAVGSLVAGFVRNVMATAAIIQFGGGLTALLPKSLIPPSARAEPSFGLHKLQSIVVGVVSKDNGKLVVGIPSSGDEPATADPTGQSKTALQKLDESIGSADDLMAGKITKARVTAVKEAHLNVQLGDNVRGRIDISAIFDGWDEIPDPKKPLQRFYEKQVMRVRVLGLIEERRSAALRPSHRPGQPVFELSARPSSLQEGAAALMPSSVDAIAAGSTWLGFVNNHGTNCLWLSLSPTVRGRVFASETSDDLSLTQNLKANFPVGCAMRVRVVSVDAVHNRLDLSARSPDAADNLTWATVKQNMVLPGRVTKTSDRQLLIQLSQSVSGPVHLVDISDDYDHATTAAYSKHDIARVSVVELDEANKRIRLSTRPSRILNSALPVTDPEITKAAQINVDDIIRGFVKNVTDKGLFVNLGGDATGFVRISDLSDKYLKDWMQFFRVDQLVRGRVMAVDRALGRIQLSLKASVLEKDYTRPLALADFRPGQRITGKVRKVVDFGAFIVIDQSANVSGLCHRSEMAEKPVEDASKLYREGDMVKAIVLDVDLKTSRISLGLKPSYFDGVNSGDMGGDDGKDLTTEIGEDAMAASAGVEVIVPGRDTARGASVGDSDSDVAMKDIGMAGLDGLDGLAAGRFDWSAAALDDPTSEASTSGGDDEASARKKRSRKKTAARSDKTGGMDLDGPQTASDYERLLLGRPDTSSLWVAYMVFQVQAGEVAKAREVAERAIKTINMREEAEKLKVWMAFINLEIDYGSDATVEAAFQRACQHNDEQEIHERVISSYIQSESPDKYEKAERLFEVMIRKFGSKSPGVWTNYGHFLYNVRESPDRGRAILSRSMQALDKRHHASLTAKFAALEFRSPEATPERGRTLFEGLLDSWPRKFDLWNQRLDLEAALFKDRDKGKKGGEADAGAVRDVFERGAKVRGLKARQARAWFERWLTWEADNGDARSREKVLAMAKQVALEVERSKTGAVQEDEEGSAMSKKGRFIGSLVDRQYRVAKGT